MLQLLSLSEHWIFQLPQDQHHSFYVWWLVIPCEVVSAEQLQQHQLHHKVGHQFQLHWPSYVFLLCCGVCVPCPRVLFIHFSPWASNFLIFHILSSGHPLLGMMICQVGETVQHPHECTLLEVSSLGMAWFASVWHWLSFVPSIPMPLRLSEMVMCVQHSSSILVVVAVRSRASSFLMSSLSLRALMNLYWTFHSFSSSVGKLHWSARAHRW